MKRQNFALVLPILAILALGLFQACSQLKSSNGSATASSTQGTPTSPVPSPTPAPTSCNAGYKLVSGACLICTAPRHYTYNFPQATFLQCAPTSSTLFSVQVPDEGYALARATMVFKNSSTQAYYWSAGIAVGDAAVDFNIGDDICPGAQTSDKVILGYGQLTAANNSTISVQATQGSSPCSNGEVAAFSGNYLDVWVEDPAPECRQQDINLVSTYNTDTNPTPPSISANYPNSVYPYFAWTNSMTQLTSVAVPATSGRSQILVMGAVEGTSVNESSTTYTTCGQTTPALISQIAANDLGILSTAQGIIPILGDPTGMGHVTLAPQILTPVAYNSATMNSVQLWVGSNLSSQINVATGGCCGDGKVGFVKSP